MPVPRKLSFPLYTLHYTVFLRRLSGYESILSLFINVFATSNFYILFMVFAYRFSLLAENIVKFDIPVPMTRKDKSGTNYDFHPTSNLDEELDFFDMDAAGNASPFIKTEPDDYTFPPHSYPLSHRNYTMHNGNPFGEGANASIDPSALSMQDNNFANYTMGSQQNMSNSFNLGNSGIGDDELLDLDLNEGSHNPNHYQQSENHMHNLFPGQSHGHESSTGAAGHNQLGSSYSHTPGGDPMQSPFNQDNFNYAQYAQLQSQQMMNVSPAMRPVQAGSLDNNYMSARSRPRTSQQMDRQASDSRSPMTPKTPGMGGLNLGTPESGSLPSRPIHANFNQHRHQKSLSAQWDNTPGSLSYIDSPISSPGHPANHPQISEILKSGPKHASLPAKVEAGTHSVGGYQTQEAKRRRRRESHNMVERRRRDNINERIQELSHLVPMHRLEDEKVRKHIANNSPLSPTLAATGRSPPQATSMLAGGGRRATGATNISMGIPPEDKDKAPNKGDILNGAVSWTRDLMWALHVKIQQEAELAELITSLGGHFPFEQSEDEKRMRTELMNAMNDNDPSSFSYSRGLGSSLRVPGHTNVMGEPLGQGQMGQMSPQSLSPGVQSGGSGTNSGGQGHPQFWQHNGQDNIGFKEEDEYNMDLQ